MRELCICQGFVVLAIILLSNAYVISSSGQASDKKREKQSIFDAAHKGDQALVEELISHGANINAKDMNGWQPIHYIEELIEAIVQLDEDKVSKLLNKLSCLSSEEYQRCSKILRETHPQSAGQMELQFVRFTSFLVAACAGIATTAFFTLHKILLVLSRILEPPPNRDRVCTREFHEASYRYNPGAYPVKFGSRLSSGLSFVAAIVAVLALGLSEYTSWVGQGDSNQNPIDKQKFYALLGVYRDTPCASREL